MGYYPVRKVREQKSHGLLVDFVQATLSDDYKLVQNPSPGYWKPGIIRQLIGWVLLLFAAGTLTVGVLLIFEFRSVWATIIISGYFAFVLGVLSLFVGLHAWFVRNFASRPL